MRSFELARPENIVECLDVLDQHGDSAFVLAGGTSGVLALRQGRVRPAVVVDLSGVGELTGARAEADGSVRVGAMVTAAVESAKETGNATSMDKALSIARIEVSRLQERVDIAKQAKDTEAAVNLGISTKRLLTALDEAEKI